MSSTEARLAIERALAEVAPEADLPALLPDADLRRELDLDSMDFLSFVVHLHDALGIEISEGDYARMRTMRACVGLVQEKLATRRTS